MTTTDVLAALASVCGFHEPDCSHCAEVLLYKRERGWTDADLLADIDLYRTDYAAWADKVRARVARTRTDTEEKPFEGAKGPHSVCTWGEPCKVFPGLRHEFARTDTEETR